MLHGEPKYRWRIRQKAAENQQKANRKHDKATEDAQVSKIIGAINHIVEKLERAQDEETPKNKGEKRRQRWEIAGLWAAAAVGAIAIILGNLDASQQREVLKGQLNQMKEAERAWIAPDRISVSAISTGPDDFGPATIYFGNIGKTPTKIYGDFRIVPGNTPESIHTAMETIAAVHAMDCPHEPEPGHVLNNSVNEFFGQEIFPGTPAAYHSSRFFVKPAQTGGLIPAKADARNDFWVMGCFYYETAG